MATLKSRLPELQAKISLAAQGVSRSLAEFWVDEAQRLVPVRTGALRDSIKARGVNQYRTDVIVGEPYGVFVEFGTHKMAAQPFFVPAGVITANQAEKIAAELMRRMVK